MSVEAAASGRKSPAKKGVSRHRPRKQRFFHETEEDIQASIEAFKKKHDIKPSEPGRAEGSIFARFLNADL